MKVEQRRHIYSALLLAVFLPALMVASLHRHADVEVLCYECQQHISHPLHIDQQTADSHECEFCHFLHAPFFAAVALSVAALVFPFISRLSFYASSHVISAFRATSPRAPPVAAL